MDEDDLHDVDSGAEEPSQEDRPESTDPVVEENSDVEPEPSPEDRPNDDEAEDANSLTDGDETQDDNQEQAPQFTPDDYKSLQAEYTRTRQELKRIQSEWQRSEQERQAEAERMQLKVWNKSHPEHGRWQELQQKRQFWQRQLGRANDEAKPVLIQQMNADFSPDEVQMLEQEAQWKSQQEYLRQSDPEAYYAQVVQRQVQQEITRQAEIQRYQQQYERILSDPAVKAYLQANPQDAQRALQSIQDPDLAADYLKRVASASGVTTELAKSQRQAAHARAQRQAQQQQATVSRDPSHRSFTDVGKEAERRAKERGIAQTHPDYMDIVGEVLSELES